MKWKQGNLGNSIQNWIIVNLCSIGVQVMNAKDRDHLNNSWNNLSF